MGWSKNIQIVSPGSLATIYAQIKDTAINFKKSDKSVSWKKHEIDKDEVSKNPLRLLYTLEDKGTTYQTTKDLIMNYTFSKEEVGKYIKFYAYVENFESIQQSTIFYVEDKHKTNIRVRGVERIDAESSDFKVGETVKLKVHYSLSDEYVPQETKDSVKWMVQIENQNAERLIIDGAVITGGEIEFEVCQEWRGQKIIFMPYLNIHTPKISYQPQVTPKCILECYWTNENKEQIDFFNDDIDKMYFYAKTSGYENGESISIEISDEDENDVVPGQKTIIIEGTIDEHGELWVEGYNNTKQ